jgi:H+/Cl- antiporter ClcA
MQIKELFIGKTKIPLPGWISLFIGGALLEGVGRFFAWEGNPTDIWHPWAPLASSVLAVFVALYGYFSFMKGKDQQDDSQKRTGIWIIVLGLFMILVSFILRPAGTPLISF